MSKKLYVGNLLYEVDDQALQDIFSQFGNIVSAQVIRYRDSGRSKGFGFVEFENEEDAAKAIEALNGQDHQGRRLVVSEARPMEARQPGDRAPRRGGNRFGDRNDRDDRNDRGDRDRGGYDRNQESYGGDPNQSQGGDDMGGEM